MLGHHSQSHKHFLEDIEKKRPPLDYTIIKEFPFATTSTPFWLSTPTTFDYSISFFHSPKTKLDINMKEGYWQ
jgi:hypothetical protein